MASGRVGGTKSKVSGTVGNEVYSIRRNEDGSYSQVVSAKAESVQYSNTDLQAAQRMVTGMVEGLMKGLRAIGTISMQSGANKSKSLNAFAQFNLMKVRDDMKANWYDSKNFYYPRKMRSILEYEQTGGYWMISSGTLQYNLFSWFGFDDHSDDWLPAQYALNYLFYGVKFEVTAGMSSIGDFLRYHKITRRDQVCYVWWESKTTWPESEEEPIQEDRYHYLIASINPYLADSTPISENALKSLFLIDSDTEVFSGCPQWHTPQTHTPDGYRNFFCFGRLGTDDEEIIEIGWHTAFSISYPEGKKKVSSSSFQNVDNYDPDPYMTQPPAIAFGSWVNQPSVRPYPSPFV